VDLDRDRATHRPGQGGRGNGGEHDGERSAGLGVLPPKIPTKERGTPQGLTLSSSGLLSGTPSGPATSYVITITATNAAGSAQQSFTLTT
jgi:hypothetical protein